MDEVALQHLYDRAATEHLKKSSAAMYKRAFAGLFGEATVWPGEVRMFGGE